LATPARRLALRILLETEEGGPTLGDLLARKEVEALPPRERGFLHELVLGTLRKRGLVDHALAALLERPLRRLAPSVRAALRLGAYQLLALRVPAHAAVSESVELARAGEARAAGLVNAVLRRLSLEGPAPLPDPGSEPLAWLTSEGSLPAWLAERWLARWGAGLAVARARAFLFPPPSSFRVNPRVPDSARRIEEAGLSPRPLSVPGAWEATAGHPGELASQAVIYLQDEGSQMVAHLAARAGLVLDACAAPGGKSTLLADLLEGKAIVIAAEPSQPRLSTLASLCRRWGSPNLRCVGADARQPPFRRRFDAVLLDAPCSGLGTIGRNPDVRWRSRPREIERHAQRQRELLSSLAPLVRSGGTLVYATCSSEPEENEHVVAGFLDAHPGFRREDPPAWAAAFSENGFARTWPERDRGDAFFAALLRRA
jgi:16S rRNA (cytosine967-C5)-methyltransferase